MSFKNDLPRNSECLFSSHLLSTSPTNFISVSLSYIAWWHRVLAAPLARCCWSENGEAPPDGTISHVSWIPSLLFNRLSNTRLNIGPCDRSAKAWNESSISKGNCTRNLLSHAYLKYGRVKIAKLFCNSGLHSPKICLWQREVLGAFI